MKIEVLNQSVKATTLSFYLMELPRQGFRLSTKLFDLFGYVLPKEMKQILLSLLTHAAVKCLGHCNHCIEITDYQCIPCIGGIHYLYNEFYSFWSLNLVSKKFNECVTAVYQNELNIFRVIAKKTYNLVYRKGDPKTITFKFGYYTISRNFRRDNILPPHEAIYQEEY